MKQNTIPGFPFVLSGLLVLCNSGLKAQEKPKYLDAKESDPIKMGWMQGSPPPADKIVYFEDGSFFQFPALRWSTAHMRQFMPTTNVSRGLGNAVPLSKALRKEIDQVKFIPLGENKSITWEESLQKVYADGVIIMQHGKIVYEKYFGALKPDGQHAAMSVTKSVTGTLGIILAKAH